MPADLDVADARGSASAAASADPIPPTPTPAAALRPPVALAMEIFDAIKSILIAIDAQNRVLWWSPSATAALGIDWNAAAGKLLTEVSEVWRHPSIAPHLQGTAHGDAIVSVDGLPYRRADGAGVLGLKIVPLHLTGSEPGARLLMCSDITERRKLELQYAQAQKLESIGRLAAGVAHEINTPTQYVGDNLRFLKDAFADVERSLGAWRCAAQDGAGATEREAAAELTATIGLEDLMAEIPKAIDQALDGIGRTAVIVLSMKEFCHPRVGETANVDLNRALMSTLTVARNEWKYLAEVVTNLAEDLPLVPCLANEMNQVFLNIIVNAAHAIEEAQRGDPGRKGRIEVATRLADESCEIVIGDNGAGIPDAIRGRIYDPFFTTKPVGKGTGQGLMIARSVIQKHGGTIDVESEVGVGTLFKIKLPLKGIDLPEGSDS
jgi:signal transduction histidine kinase